MKVSTTLREPQGCAEDPPKVFTKAWINHVCEQTTWSWRENHLKKIAGTVFSIQMGLILTAVSVPIT